MIAETAKKCRFCGEVLNASIAPAADAGAGAAMPPGGIANAPGAAKLLLYNPNVASSLSVFFTAIFGSWCCRHNYQALGLPEKARRSQIWMIVS
ncbi:MAG: hypothetical protein J6333_04340, partial [Planctomycetes bacterium]|nr:hypothetical protein [Planctomycetota bacterium]